MGRTSVNPPAPAAAALARIADEFVECLRRGEYPSLRGYTDRFPHLANEILEVLPTLAAVERHSRFGPTACDAACFDELDE